eukprot:9470149-Pyramimonas_sp.AAC.2
MTTWRRHNGEVGEGGRHENTKQRTGHEQQQEAASSSSVGRSVGRSVVVVFVVAFGVVEWTTRLDIVSRSRIQDECAKQ